jgi:hypothetical protein|tara:strand:- start:152 stop:928 length:777 start_codon:yes stop_codon:yes gene_type:complete
MGVLTIKGQVIGGGKQIEPITWEPYKGETVNTNLTIRQGKRIQETAYYEDRVKAVPRGNAYCIGNGPSRKGFDLNRLKDTGQTYGCNALYRDFIPDYIFSIDAPITNEMWRHKVYEKCIHYAPSLEVNRYPKGGPPLLHLIPNNPHWICGNQAMWTAGVHGHKNIYLIGYDFRDYGKEELNNMYQDTENYGPRHGDEIMNAWLKQFRDLLKMRPYINFIIVHDNPPEYMDHLQTGTDLGNSKVINYNEFEKILTPSQA